MTVLLTLTTAGTDATVFDLYSNLDSFTTAFETNVSRASLLAGYSTALCPDYTNIVRVQATVKCVNYVDIILSNTTTTTTSTTVAPTTTTSTTVAPTTTTSTTQI